MKKLNLKKTLVFTILLVGTIGTTAFANTIGGVTYTTYSMSSAGGATEYRTTPTGGRVRGEVTQQYNGTNTYVFERRTAWNVPNVALASWRGVGMSAVVGGQLRGDQFRIIATGDRPSFFANLHL